MVHDAVSLLVELRENAHRDISRLRHAVVHAVGDVGGAAYGALVEIDKFEARFDGAIASAIRRAHAREGAPTLPPDADEPEPQTEREPVTRGSVVPS